MKLNMSLLTPRWCRWDSENPAPLTLWLNILFACAGGFTSANLYYSHPILHVLAEEFHTTQSGVANIPTLALAGDATGLVLLLPLGDFFPRRKFTLFIMTLCATLWLGLCITKDLDTFMVLSYFSGLFNGVNQIMIPLVSELSTDKNRAFNISIVAMGPTFGILLARILSGIVATYTSWRNVYWIALGLQTAVIVLLWLLMPDYPSVNPQPLRKTLKDYPKIIWSIVTLYTRHPVLVQACLLVFSTFFTVSSFWTTLTFLLSEAPFHYTPFVIGLFGLIGASTMVLGPLYGKYIVGPLASPLHSATIGKLVNLVGIIIGTFAGPYTAAGPALQAVFLDAGLMILSISNRVAIHPLEPKQRNRVNTAYTGILYVGMVTGAKAGNDIYQRCGGWIASGSLSIGVIGFGLAIIMLRGPWENGWVGWHGGWGLAIKVKSSDEECSATDGDEGVRQQAEKDIRSSAVEAAEKSI
jgi:predicted MFS family arabinose efflux permease